MSTLFDLSLLFTRAAWVLVVLSFITAPVGCFMVWRKMSYFGATLAHSAILGAIIGIVLGVNVLFGVIGFNILLAFLLVFLLQNKNLASDTLLGIMAHLSLAVGVIAISMMDNLRIDLMSYLFGDVLAVSLSQFYIICVFSLLSGLVIIFCWRGFLNLCFNPDIAKVEGYSILSLELSFIVTLAITISLGMQAIGVLLIVAMLIIPAASARMISFSIRQMVFFTWIITLFSSLFGLYLSYYFDFPAGATIVTLSGCLFILIRVFSYLILRKTM